jgi:hypothetical protein
MPNRKKSIAMLPREPLTKKARSAIILYVKVRAKSYTTYEVVDMTLKAERMSRAKLYAYLHERGFRWDSRVQRWRELKRKPAAPKPEPVAAKKKSVAAPSKAAQEALQVPDDIAQFIRDNAANIRSAR